MRTEPSPTDRERRRAGALAAARAEAAQLREIRRLQREEGVPYVVGMRRVGLVLPHATLQRRLRRLDESGVEGLLDRRHAPPSKLTPKIRGFIEGEAAHDPHLSVLVIIERVAERFKITFKPRTIEDVLHKAGLARPVVHFTSEVQPATLRAAAHVPVPEPVAAAGMAWLPMGDDCVGYTAGLAEAIQKITDEFPPAQPVTDAERAVRDEQGHFLPEYNAVEERRDPEVGARFESVEAKRAEKDLGRLRIVHSRPEILQQKLLALMALPMVTDRGHFDGATDVRGTWLEGLGGIDYMPETLSKFARELKWANVSGALAECHAQIWHRQTAHRLGEKDACCSILYVDATTKPLWTDHFHKSGRVAMLGRVMPCVETVTIHEGAGVPLWIRTYSGHVALVKNVLPLIQELESAIGEGMLGRLTVIDGEMDCVALFQEFDLQKRYFITPLDHSRVKTLAAIQALGRFVPYRETDQIAGGRVDLMDSRGRAPEFPPYPTRVIVLQRANKDTYTVLATNAPPEEFADAVLVDAYFSRWPHQEAIFRDLKRLTAFNGAHGYGKQRVINISVIDAMTQLTAQLERLETRKAMCQKNEEREAAAVHDREMALRATERSIASRNRVLQRLKDEGKANTAAYQRHEEALAAAQQDVELQSLRLKEAQRRQAEVHEKTSSTHALTYRKQRELDELSTKREIYQTDVELDQILSILKVGFLLVLQFVIHEFFGNMKIDPMTFAYQILLLPGDRTRTDEMETIRFHAHRRNPEMMKTLEQACARFNARCHRHEGRRMIFEVHWPPGMRDHAT